MKIKNALMLLVASLIWGIAFTAQSSGMEYIEPFTFNGVRSFLGTVVLLPVILFINRKNNKKLQTDKTISSGQKRDLWLGGCTCGVILFAGSSLQQIGLQYTEAGKPDL